MENKKVYISGPMTGIENDNRAEFERAEAWLIKQWYYPITPFKLMLEQDRGRAFSQLAPATYSQRLAYDIKAMAEMVQVVFVLPGWEQSVGAALEVAFAVSAMGIPVMEAYTQKPISLNVVVSEAETDCKFETMEEILDKCVIKFSNPFPSVMTSNRLELLHILQKFMNRIDDQLQSLSDRDSDETAISLQNTYNFIEPYYRLLTHGENLSHIERNAIRLTMKESERLYAVAMNEFNEAAQPNGPATGQAVAN